MAVIRWRSLPGVVVTDDEVVAVAEVPADAEAGREPVVERVEVPVGEPLAGQVADGQPAAALERREQRVAGEVCDSRFLVVRPVHEAIQQGEERWVFQEPAEAGLEDIVVEAGEELPHVQLQGEAEPAEQRL